VHSKGGNLQELFATQSISLVPSISTISGLILSTLFKMTIRPKDLLSPAWTQSMVMQLLPLSLLLDWTLKLASWGGEAVRQKDNSSSRAWDPVGGLECFLCSTGQLCSHLTLKEVGREVSGSCFAWVSGADKRADIKKAACRLDA
jgi:hypothetical protein